MATPGVEAIPRVGSFGSNEKLDSQEYCIR